MADYDSSLTEKRKQPVGAQASEASDSDDDHPILKRLRISEEPGVHAHDSTEDENHHVTALQDSEQDPAETDKYDPDYIRIPKARGKAKDDLNIFSAQDQKNNRRCVNCWRFGKSQNGFHPYRQCIKKGRVSCVFCKALHLPYLPAPEDETLKALEKDMDEKRAEVIALNCIQEDTWDYWYSKTDPLAAAEKAFERALVVVGPKPDWKGKKDQNESAKEDPKPDSGTAGVANKYILKLDSGEAELATKDVVEPDSSRVAPATNGEAPVSSGDKGSGSSRSLLRQLLESTARTNDLLETLVERTSVTNDLLREYLEKDRRGKSNDLNGE